MTKSLLGRSSGDEGARSLPAWCEEIPVEHRNESCSGQACKCVSWCHWVPGFAREWVPDCCGCEGRSPSFDQVSPAYEPAPEWCELVPVQVRSGACKGFSQCMCQDWCAGVPPKAWHAHLGCCACLSPGSADVASSAHSLVEPAWCDSVPPASREDSCRSSRCTCEASCENDVPSFTWKWNRNCCGCAAATGAVTEKVGALVLFAAAVASPHDMPSWCLLVAEDKRGDACWKGAPACACQGWCQEQASPSMWHLSPECCGCDWSSSLDWGRKGDADEALATRTAPKGTLRQEPVWCEYVAEEEREEACQVSRGCDCKPWCHEHMPRFAWPFTPQCCGCHGEGDAELAAIVLAAMAESIPEDAPSWQRFVPAQERCSHGGCGCACQAWCQERAPRRTWHLNPKCCACS